MENSKFSPPPGASSVPEESPSPGPSPESRIRRKRKHDAQLDMDEGTAASAAAAIARQGGGILARAETKAEQTRQLEAQISKQHWEEVYKLFETTGNPTLIGSKVGLDTPAVEHLLKNGLTRLGLPPIQRHAVNNEEVQRRLATYQLAEPPPERSCTALGPAVQSAATERAAREALAAQLGLDMTLEATAIVHGWVSQVRKLATEGKYELPPTIDQDVLGRLVRSLDANTKALERAVGLSRLTAGEPSNIAAMQMAVLISQVPVEELAYAARHRTLPPSLRSHGGALSSIQQRIIDADSEPGSPRAEQAQANKLIPQSVLLDADEALAAWEASKKKAAPDSDSGPGPGQSSDDGGGGA